MASNQSSEIIVEKNGKLKLFEAATSIKRLRPPFGGPSESSPIVVTSCKCPSSALYTQFGLMLSRNMMKKNAVLDRRVAPNCGPVKLISFTRLFQNKVEFLLKILLIYDEVLLSGQSPLSAHLPGPFVSAYVPLYNRDLTKLRRRRRRRQQPEHQKINRFNEQNNNSARAPRFFVHFFAVPVQLRHEMTKF